MIIVVYGDDFRTREKVHELREAFEKKIDPTGLNLSVYTDSSLRTMPGDMIQAATSFPFLAPKRFVLVRDVLGNAKKDEAELWETAFPRIPDTTILVFWETGNPETLLKKPILASLKQEKDVHVYPLPGLEGRELDNWIAERLRTRKTEPVKELTRLIAERTGGNLWEAAQAIDVLSSYGNGKPVSIEVAEKLVRPSPGEGAIFALMDAFAARSSADAMKKLIEERFAGTDDFQLFAMIARQVRLLLGAHSLLEEHPHASQGEAAQALGVSPFPASKALQQAKKFTKEELIHIHDLLFRLDLEMKSGGADAELSVDLLLEAFTNKK